MSRKSDKNAHLLVEGKNDQHVIWALCDIYQVPKTFDVLVPGAGGIDEVLADFPIRLKEAGLQSLGIVVDADEDIQARWSSVRDRLLKSGYSLPAQPPEDGLITVLQDRPRVGVWVMPDNRVPGMLENFVAHLIPNNDSLEPIVGETLQSIEDNGLNRYRPAHKPKALIHTWLAWQEVPGMPMGQAITTQVLNHNQALARQFVDWLTRLFV